MVCASVPDSGFLPWLSSMTDCKLNKPVPLHAFDYPITAAGGVTRTRTTSYGIRRPLSACLSLCITLHHPPLSSSVNWAYAQVMSPNQVIDVGRGMKLWAAADLLTPVQSKEDHLCVREKRAWDFTVGFRARTDFKMYELFISGIFQGKFSDHSWCYKTNWNSRKRTGGWGGTTTFLVSSLNCLIVCRAGDAHAHVEPKRKLWESVLLLGRDETQVTRLSSKHSHPWDLSLVLSAAFIWRQRKNQALLLPTL